MSESFSPSPEETGLGIEIERRPGEACGIFGIYDPEINVAIAAHNAALAQQHRGQEAGGISVSFGDRIETVSGLGLMSRVFPDKESIRALGGGYIATSHVRYGTITIPEPERAAQPIPREGFSIAHNGHWQDWVLDELGAGEKGRTDTERSADYIYENIRNNESMENALKRILPSMSQGAFSLVINTADQLFAIRDPMGFRPLVLGKSSSGWAVASETGALPEGYEFKRDIRRGEMLIIDQRGIRSTQPFTPQESALCAYELGYFTAPASEIGGRQVEAYRYGLGKALAHQDRLNFPDLEIDVVSGVPDSGTPAGEGYAAASGVRWETLLQKNRYVGRTFIKPEDQDRSGSVRTKLKPYRERIEDQRVLLVDDSIVRGNTTRELVQMMFSAGAAEVHIRSSMPQYIAECHMGMDTYNSELIARRYNQVIEDIRRELNATSLDFLELPKMHEVFSESGIGLCTACMTGEYPIQISAPVK